MEFPLFSTGALAINPNPSGLLRVSATKVKAFAKFTFFIALCLSGLDAPATLVISLYRNDAIFLGSDSLISTSTTNQPGQNKTGQKIFQASSNCCFAMTGTFNSTLQNTNPEKDWHIDYAAELKKLCDATMSKAEPSMVCISNVPRRFANYYGQIAKEQSVLGITPAPPTRVCTFGFGRDKEVFFGYSWLFDSTNIARRTIHFDSGFRSQKPNLTGLGERWFIPDLEKHPERFRSIPKAELEKLRTALQELQDSNTAISDSEIAAEMLIIFTMHKLYANQLGYDDGAIGPPYVIYKITKDRVEKINIDRTEN